MHLTVYSAAATYIAGDGHVMQERRSKGNNGLFCCPCCGYATLEEANGYDICCICFWEDDGQDDPEADECWGGPNHVSLTEGRMNYLRIGASDPKDERHCRAPKTGDERLRFFVVEDGKLIERKA